MHSTTGKYYPASRAVVAVKNALMNGLLTRPESCELCGAKPEKKKRTRIQAHHWNGYDHPTDIWWCCASCNAYLVGNRFHIGKVNIEEARAYIESRKIKIPSGRCRAIGLNGQQCGNRATGKLYCHHHREP